MRNSSANTVRTKPVTGDTKTSFVNEDHLGWFKCDGRLLDTTTFNLLFQVIGYTFGGSGASFNLPNAQGRVLGSTGAVVDENEHSHTYLAGDSVGELDHQLTIAEMPAHNHNSATVSPGANTTAVGTTSFSTTGITTNATGPISGGGGGGTGYGLIYQDGTNTMNASVNSGNEPNLYTTSIALTITDPSHTHTIASNGNNQYHNNIQPTLFYGNLFIYSGVPFKTGTFTFPYTTGVSPVLI